MTIPELSTNDFFIFGMRNGRLSLDELDRIVIQNLTTITTLTISSEFDVTTERQRSDNDTVALSLGFGISDDPTTRKTIHFTIAMILTLVGVLGTFGNGLVLYIFTRYQRLRSGGGPLILSLATGDLMVSILHILPAYSSYMEIWSFGKLGCEFYAGAVGLGGLASLITLSAIAADRFCVIFGKPITWIARQTTCICIWSLSACLVLPPILGWSKYCLEGIGTSCSWDYSSRSLSNRFYYVFLLSFGFGLPVTVIIVSYIGILRVVFKHTKEMNGISGNGVMSTTSPTKTDIRTAQVVFTLIVCFLVSWTPYAIVSFIGQFGTPGSLSQLSMTLPALFAKASVIYNPIIYGLSHPHFRSAVKSICTRSSTHQNLAQLQCYQGSPRHQETPSRQIHRPSTCSRSPLLMERQSCGQRTESRAYAFPTLISTQLRNETLIVPQAYYQVDQLPSHGWNTSRKSSHTSQSGFRGLHAQKEVPGQGQFKRKRIHSYGVSINYSEPDLHRDDRIVKNPNLITQNEYRWRKHSWLRKVLFRSESCLDHILRSDGFNHMAKLAMRGGSTTSDLRSSHYARKHISPIKRYAYTSLGQPPVSVTIHTSPRRHHPNTSRRNTSLSIASSGTYRKKSSASATTSVNYHQVQKRDSNLLALPLRFEDGISGGRGQEEEVVVSSRRSSGGRKSSSSGSKGSGGTQAHVQKRLSETASPHQFYPKRKSSNNSEMTAIHYGSQRSGSQSQSKKFSFESTTSKHQWKYFLMHQRDCCECSFKLSVSCPQDHNFLSFDYAS